MNSVNIIGYVHEIREKEYRRLQISKPTFDENGNNQLELFIKYWAGGEKNYLLSLPNKSHVAIHGHIDYDDRFGIIVIVEQLYCLKKENENTKIH